MKGIKQKCSFQIGVKEHDQNILGFCVVQTEKQFQLSVYSIAGAQNDTRHAQHGHFYSLNRSCNQNTLKCWTKKTFD